MSAADRDDTPPDWLDRDAERLLDAFEVAWQSLHPPDLAEFVAHHLVGWPAEKRVALLAELVRIDLEYRWRTTHVEASSASGAILAPPSASESTHLWPLSVDNYCRRFDLPMTAELLRDEYRVRRKCGAIVDSSDYLKHYGHVAGLADQLAVVDAEFARRAPVARPSSTRPNVVAPPVPSAPAPPTRIGRYAIRSLLGAGTFGSVYLAHDERLARPVAIKLLHREVYREQSNLDRCLHEARLAAQVSHPALVRVYDADHDGDFVYLVMEYIRGETLQQALAAGRFTQRRAAELVTELAEALHEAHGAGLVHRDVKPGNILLDAAQRPHLTDFGLAIRAEEQREASGQIWGTPAYMSPEQVRGERQLDGRTDLWSLGVILFEMLAGRRPFLGHTPSEIFDAIKYAEPPSLRQLDSSIAPELERLCLRCLAKSPAQRPASGKDIALDLQRLGLRSTSPSTFALPQDATHLPGATAALREGTPRTNLPRAADTFVGREPELADLAARLTTDVRLVTLTGPGGIGKTRFALQLAHDLLDRFEGGCWWVDVTNVASVADVAKALLQAFRVSVQGTNDEELVDGLLAFRPPLLLVLDNAESSLEPVRAAVRHWVSRQEHARFLVTSRVPLGTAGERLFELSSLPAPPPDLAGQHLIATDLADVLARFPSVRLFVERACEADASFALTPDNVAAVSDICRRLEGIPLGIELAAARVKILKPAQIATKLSPQLLRSRRTDVAPRQQTLEQAVDWSFRLLDPLEQQVFLQLCGFSGGFTLDAAEAVVEADAPDAPPVIDVVQSLREKSLVRTVDTPNDLRFVMYGIIREYGQQRRPPAAVERFCRRLAAYLLDYTEAWSARLHTRDGVEAVERLMAESDNVQVAYDAAFQSGERDVAARLLLALAGALEIRGYTEPWRLRLEQCAAGAAPERRAALQIALSQAYWALGKWDAAAQAATAAVEVADGSARSAAQLQAGRMQRLLGNLDAADRLLAAAEAGFRAVRDALGIARSLLECGFLLWRRGHFDESLACYREADRLAREQGDLATVATAARQRGHVLFQRGELENARAGFVEAEALARRLADRRAMHMALSSQGMVLAEQANYTAALRCYAESERLAGEIGDRRGVAINQANRGLALADQGDYAAALQCHATAEQINRQIGNMPAIALNLGNRGVMLSGLGQHEEALTCLRESLRIHESLSNPMQVAINRGDIGGVLLAMDRPHEARTELEAAVRILVELGAEGTIGHLLYRTALAQACQRLNDVPATQSAAAAAEAVRRQLGVDATHLRLRVREAVQTLESIRALANQ